MKPKKLAASKKFAAERGLPVSEHVLIPRTKGFVASVQGLRDHIDALYDITIGYVEGVPTLWQWIKGAVRRVHINVRRFTVEEIPQEAEALAQWLKDRYQEKDRILETFYRNGVFPEKETTT